jgi:UDP-N-acetylmuramoyl-tripeptide--D-alanyl-D-alanine ligase
VGYTTDKDLEGLEGDIVSSDPYLLFKALFPKGWLYIKTRLVGSYNLENALAAATIGQYFGIDPVEISSAIEAYQPDNNRSQLVVTDRNQLLLDAYNANPSSTRAALENFAGLRAEKKGVILGDMFELGTVSQAEHQKMVDYLSGMNLDLILLTGPYYSGCRIPGNFHSFSNTDDLIAYLNLEKPSGYFLLIKGSRGMKLEIIRPLL